MATKLSKEDSCIQNVTFKKIINIESPFHDPDFLLRCVLPPFAGAPITAAGAAAPLWCTNSAGGGGDPGSGYAFIMLANRAGTGGVAPLYGDCCECEACAEPFPAAA